jgi:hypothetical protein
MRLQCKWLLSFLFYSDDSNIVVRMLFKLLNQSGFITFEGDAVKGPCHAPFSETRRADVCGMQCPA